MIEFHSSGPRQALLRHLGPFPPRQQERRPVRRCHPHKQRSALGREYIIFIINRSSIVTYFPYTFLCLQGPSRSEVSLKCPATNPISHSRRRRLMLQPHTLA